MPEVGIEPTRGCPRRILNPVRLPVSPLRHSYFTMTYWLFYVGHFSGTTSFTISFEFPLLSYSYMESTNIEDLQDKQNSKNTCGIMKYQLRIFQLILVVFSTDCASDLERTKELLRQWHPTKTSI